MPLTDLLRHARPPGITCEKYIPGEGKRCGYYLESGACVRPDEFMCVEFLKRNPVRPARPTEATDPRVDALAHLHQLRDQLAAEPGAGR